MWNCWKTDMKKMIFNKRFFYSVIGMVVALTVSGISMFRDQGKNINMSDCFTVVSGFGFILVYYVLSVIAGGMDYGIEKKSHYKEMMMIRIGKRRYILSKIITSSMGGYLSMLLGMAIFYGIFCLVIASMRGGFTEMYSGQEQWEDQLWYILVFCLLGSVLSVIGTVITVFIPNIFVGCSAPVLIYYMVITLTNKHWNVWTFMPSCIYFSQYKLFGSYPAHFLYACLYSDCIIYFMYRLVLWKVRRVESV